MKAAYSLHYVRATLSDTSRQTTKFSRYAKVRNDGGNLAPRNRTSPFCGARTTQLLGSYRPLIFEDTPGHQLNESFTPPNFPHWGMFPQRGSTQAAQGGRFEI